MNRQVRYRLLGCQVLLLAVATLLAWRLPAAESVDRQGQAQSQEQAALHLGQQVLRLRQALAKPEAPESMQAVLELGQQQAAYMMVRGWLSYQLQADLSLLAANPQANASVRQRVAFLQQAIRRLDLE